MTDLLERRHPGKRRKARRYFDSKFQATMVKVLPGEFEMTGNPSEMLITTLGSCVSACIRNPLTGFGGMNHFMLPDNEGRSSWGEASLSFRYGNHAMEILINEVIRSGCPKEELEIKVFGGGNVTSAKTKIGSSNADFVLAYLENESLEIAVADLGGEYGRRICYSPYDGRVKRLFLKRASDSLELSIQEKTYKNNLLTPLMIEDSDIKLWDVPDN